MTVLTVPQLKRLASDAGFKGSDLDTAVAIALAESSGETSATHKNADKSTDIGLWQINSVHFGTTVTAVTSEGPATFTVNSINMMNPNLNVATAFQLYRTRKGFADWTTYKDGSYKNFLPKVTGAATQSATDRASEGTQQVVSQAVDMIPAWVKTYAADAAIGFVAIMSFAAGVAILISESQTARQTVGTMAKAAGTIAKV